MKKQSIISSDIDSINQNKKQLVNAHKDKIDETFDLLKEIEIVIKKNEASKLSEQLKTLAQKKKSLNFKKACLKSLLALYKKNYIKTSLLLKILKHYFKKNIKKSFQNTIA